MIKMKGLVKITVLVLVVMVVDIQAMSEPLTPPGPPGPLGPLRPTHRGISEPPAPPGPPGPLRPIHSGIPEPPAPPTYCGDVYATRHGPFLQDGCSCYTTVTFTCEPEMPYHNDVPVMSKGSGVTASPPVLPSPNDVPVMSKDFGATARGEEPKIVETFESKGTSVTILPEKQDLLNKITD